MNFTGVRSEFQSSCQHPHRCNRMHFTNDVKCCFDCFQSLLFVSLLRGKRTIYIYIFIQTPLTGFRFVQLALQDGWASLALQRHASQNAVLQAFTLGHMRSNDYSTTTILVNIFFLLSTLSIMSTNHCSPTVYAGSESSGKNGKNNLNYVPKLNKRLACLERHEGE